MTSETISKEKIEQASKDYENTLSELKEYNKDSQKLVSIISLIITAAFVIGLEKNVKVIFPVVPIISFILLQYLVSINYAYRVREIYAHSLETFLNTFYLEYPGLYSKQIKKYYLDLKWWEFILHPFSATIAVTFLLLITISIYSIYKSYSILIYSLGISSFIIYIIICCFMLLYLFASTIWSLIKLYKNNS